MTWRTIVAGLGSAVLVLPLLAGCGGAPQAGATPATPAGSAQAAVPVVAVPPDPQLPVTLTDAAGQQVRVDAADRIVSLSGGVTEILIAMGLGDRVVGRDVSSDAAEVADVPLLTQGHDVSAEQVLAAAPNVVFVDEQTGPPEALDAVRDAGIAVVQIPEAWSLDEVPTRVRAVARAVGAPASGAAVVQQFRTAIAEIPQVADDPKVAFLYLRGSAAVYLLGGDGSGADSLIEAVGGVDAGSAAGLGSFTPLTPEALVEAAPDVILVMTKGLESVGGVDGLLALPGVAQTPAGRNRAIVAIPDGQLLNFGPRTPATVRMVADQLS